MTRQIGVILVMAATLTSAGTSVAQTIPFQSTQRAGIGSGLGQSSLPSGNFIEPRIEATVQYVANVELVGNGMPQIDMGGLELAPGIYASHSSDSIIAAIDYSLIGRAWEESDYDDVSHRLSANGQWFAVPEWFNVRAQASYSDAVIDARNGLDYGGLGIFGPGNLTEVATASAGPELLHRFDELEFNAVYSYGRVWYLDVGDDQPVVGFLQDQDSVDQSAHVGFGTFDEAARVSANISYDWQRSDYDEALPYEYEQAGLDAGYRIGRSLMLVGSAGLESDLDESTTEGGLDADFWSAGVRWDPSDRTSAEARFGHRYFGDTYLLRANHRARLLEFDASYTEEPTVETRVLSLGGFNPGELPPGLPDVNFGGLNSSPYVGRNADIGVTAVGSRTSVGVSVFRYERDFVREVVTDETRTGVYATGSRQLASNLSLDLNVAYTDFETAVTVAGPALTDSATYYDTQYSVRLNRSAGARFTVGGEAGYLSRSGDADYEGWWVALRTRWIP